MITRLCLDGVADGVAEVEDGPPPPFPLILGDNLGFDLSSDSNFKGEADADQSNSLSGDLTAVVTQVLANGNLVVRGEKIMTLNQGDERIGLVGEVRPADIGPDNVVLSTRVANAHIVYDGTGQVADASKMGWVARFFISALMPF